MSFDYKNFILSNNARLTQEVEGYLQKTTESTPVGTDLKGLENALLLRTISVLFGATVLPHDLEISEYNALKRKIVRCLVEFQEDRQGVKKE